MAIFVTGASGYIGGAVAARLVTAGEEVRALARSEDTARQLTAAGMTAVLGSLDDADLLAREARAAELVINAADSDHRGAAEALIDGLTESGKPMLHTSGTGMLAQDTGGDTADRIVDDVSLYLPAPEAEDHGRAAIDHLVRDASHRGVRSVVLCHSSIYGWGRGLHRESIQLPWLMKQARTDGVARYIGTGEATWSNVHIDDVVDLYLLAAQRASQGSCYLVENGESSFAQIAEAISDRLRLSPPRSWTVEEAAARCGPVYAYLFGSTCRVRATRARTELNWQPRHRSMTAWIRREA